jgi:hypothetical protein
LAVSAVATRKTTFPTTTLYDWFTLQLLNRAVPYECIPANQRLWSIRIQNPKNCCEPVYCVPLNALGALVT